MTSVSMYRVGDLLPCHDLFFTPKSRCIRPFRADASNTINSLKSKSLGSVHLPLPRHKNTFGDDEPSTAGSALTVILLHNVGRNGSGCAVAGEPRHEDTVVNRDGAEFERAEETCDGCHFVWLVCGGVDGFRAGFWPFK